MNGMPEITHREFALDSFRLNYRTDLQYVGPESGTALPSYKMGFTRAQFNVLAALSRQIYNTLEYYVMTISRDPNSQLLLRRLPPLQTPAATLHTAVYTPSYCSFLPSPRRAAYVIIILYGNANVRHGTLAISPRSVS